MNITIFDAASFDAAPAAPFSRDDDFAAWLSATPVWRRCAATLDLPAELQSAAANYEGFEEWRGGAWRYRPAGWVANDRESLAPLEARMRGRQAGSPGLEHIDPAAYFAALEAGLTLYVGVDDADTFMRNDVPQRHVALAINEDGTRGAVLWDSRQPMLDHGEDGD